MRKDLLIVSGKGGTGKSTIALNLALALVDDGFKVGLLDADVTSPNIPKMLGMGKTRLLAKQIVDPVVLDNGLKIMSVGFDAKDEQGIMWKGVLISSVINELIDGVGWGELDYLVMDMPPGSSDDLMAAIGKLPKAYAVVVTNPSSTARMDASKLLYLLRLKQIRVAGIIENMAGLFGDDFGVELAEEYDVPFLGEVKFHKKVPRAMANGDNILAKFKDFNMVLLKLVGGLK